MGWGNVGFQPQVARRCLHKLFRPKGSERYPYDAYGLKAFEVVSPAYIADDVANCVEIARSRSVSFVVRGVWCGFATS